MFGYGERQPRDILRHAYPGGARQGNPSTMRIRHLRQPPLPARLDEGHAGPFRPPLLPGRRSIRPLLGRWALTLACCAGSVAPALAQLAPTLPDRFPVTAVRVEGNTLLPESALSPLVASVPGEARSLADLRRAAARIQAAYRQAGYGGVVAYVPEQSLAEGKAVIRVVEGKIAKVRIKGEGRFYSTDNVRASLPALREGRTPVVKAVDRDIQLANENSAKELRVTLSAGAAPGDIDADVEVAEQNPLRFMASFDNTGEPRTGDYRLGVGVQHANLFHADHVGSAQFQTSPGEPDRVRIYSLGYRVPLYGLASSLDAFYAYSSVTTGTTTTTAGPLSFAGKGTVVGLRANRYLDRIGEYDHRITLGSDWREYLNDCAIGALGPAACGPAGADLRIAPLSLAYVGQEQTPSGAWGINVALSRNIGGSRQEDFSAARAGATRDYQVWRLSAFAEIPVASGYGLAGRASFQYSPDALVPGEQLGLGGAASVRAYRERELAGDYGYFLSLEALGPKLPAAMLPDTSLRPLVFVDHGTVANHHGKPCRGLTEHQCSLSSVGLGLRIAAGKYASARVDIGRALEDGIVKSAGSLRGHVAISLAY